MTTAGGLMFQSAPDGNVQAYHARTGNMLWQFQIGAAGGPPLSYEIDGEQHIAAIAPAGVWAFKLGGTVAQASAPVRPRRSLSRGRLRTRRRLKRLRSFAIPGLPVSTT